MLSYCRINARVDVLGVPVGGQVRVQTLAVPLGLRPWQVTLW